MELRQLKTFQVVARLLSFNRAAEILHYAPSTVSTQIRLLEEEFGVPLFDRLGKRVRLTSAGQMLVRYAQRMLDIEKETVAKVAGWEEPHGTISIRIPQSVGTYLLPSVLHKFQQCYPKIGFDIRTCAYDTLIHELKNGITDLAFLLADSIPFSELKTELLRVEPLFLVSSPQHPIAAQSVLRIGDLAGQSILLPKYDCSYKMLFEQILFEEKVGPATFMEINSIEAIKQCVLKGIGVAMMPVMAITAELAQQKLAILPWSEEKLETAILMIWHRDKWLPPTLQAFMDTVREVMRSPEDGQ
ncbi:MAG: LysR family transcriptional regulator [Desulfobacterales bacterium]|nr:LysR family transcriptional regulator [Desulfobacterales bacterium]